MFLLSFRALSLRFLLISPLIDTVVSGTPLKPDIRADTNRDGVVDIDGNSDIENKSFWTESRGAIFLPNIGDSTGRCPKTDLKSNPLSNDELAGCNDASGHLLLDHEYVAPLQTVPMSSLSDNAFARIYTTPDAAYSRVRLFVQDGSNKSHSSNWRLVDRDFMFNATQLKDGIVLGMDSRELVTDANLWNGIANVRFEVFDGNSSGVDMVAMKLAPVLVHHHLQPVDVIFTTAGNDTSPTQQSFVRELESALGQAKIKAPLLQFNQSDDIWAQDFLEPGYASMPGLNGPIAIRVMLRSAQSTRTAGRQIFEQLRGKGIGGYQPHSGFGHREIDSFGNLETIPPYTSKSGITYKAGRIVMGKHFNNYPAEPVLKFLRGQGLQDPLILEAGWLAIGHVDEFVQFLPFENDLGFTIAVADTTSALQALREVRAAGQGSTRAITYNGTMEKATFSDPVLLSLTVDNLLEDESFVETYNYAQKYIDYNVNLLLQEISLPREQILRVPTLFLDVTYHWPITPDGLPTRLTQPLPGEKMLKSFYPESINGLVVGHHYFAPKPWGPIIGGKDIIEEAVKDAYARANMTVSFINDYSSHHVQGGEVHCGTNTLRQANLQWWL